MASRLRCPSCDKPCPAPADRQAVVRCGHCGRTFPARPSDSDSRRSDEAGRSGRRSRVDDDWDDRPRGRAKKSTSNSVLVILLVVGGVAALGLVGAIAVVGYVFLPRPPANRPAPAAAAPPPAGPVAVAPGDPVRPIDPLPPFQIRPDLPPNDGGRPRGPETLPPAKPPAQADERIANGDFEQGARGFRTGYQHSPGNLRESGTFCVVTDPHNAHDSAASFNDHTSGRGFLLAVNGSDLPDLLLWGQDVAVKPGAEYTLSLWVASWFFTSPAELEVRINGREVGRVIASTKTGEWKELRATWTAGNDSRAVIEIYNRTREISGNDFAIDDISLRGPAP